MIATSIRQVSLCYSGSIIGLRNSIRFVEASEADENGRNRSISVNMGLIDAESFKHDP